MSAPVQFSFPSFRSLCRYLGETDAIVELSELAARAFLAAARESGDAGAFVLAASAKHGVCVNLAEVGLLAGHLARSHIVTVYQSAERFLHEFRQEHISLFRRPWSGDRNDVDPLTLTLENIAASRDSAEQSVGKDLISRFQYYRLVRNSIVHTKDSGEIKACAAYNAIVEYSGDSATKFARSLAPHPPDSLNFDDFVLFSRITKAIAEKLCVVSAPTSEDFCRLLQSDFTRFKRFSNKPARMINAVASHLRTLYGIDDATAKWLASGVCDMAHGRGG